VGEREPPRAGRGGAQAGPGEPQVPEVRPAQPRIPPAQPPDPTARAPRPRMASHPAGRLSALLAGTRRLALVGLAKNTGKTVTLAAILAEHAAAGLPVGVTSIGRDGEEHDVIDARIEKPRVNLQ